MWASDCYVWTHDSLVWLYDLYVNLRGSCVLTNFSRRHRLRKRRNGRDFEGWDRIPGVGFFGRPTVPLYPRYQGHGS
jgi:hypothetical protein